MKHILVKTICCTSLLVACMAEEKVMTAPPLPAPTSHPPKYRLHVEKELKTADIMLKDTGGSRILATFRSAFEEVDFALQSVSSEPVDLLVTVTRGDEMVESIMPIEGDLVEFDVMGNDQDVISISVAALDAEGNVLADSHASDVVLEPFMDPVLLTLLIPGGESEAGELVFAPVGVVIEREEPASQVPSSVEIFPKNSYSEEEPPLDETPIQEQNDVVLFSHRAGYEDHLYAFHFASGVLRKIEDASGPNNDITYTEDGKLYVLTDSTVRSMDIQVNGVLGEAWTIGAQNIQNLDIQPNVLGDAITNPIAITDYPGGGYAIVGRGDNPFIPDVFHVDELGNARMVAQGQPIMSKFAVNPVTGDVMVGHQYDRERYNWNFHSIDGVKVTDMYDATEEDSMVSLEFSPDGLSYAVLRNAEIRVYDASSHEVLHVLQFTKPELTASLCWSSDSKRIAVLSNPGDFALYDVPTESELFRYSMTTTLPQYNGGGLFGRCTWLR